MDLHRRLSLAVASLLIPGLFLAAAAAPDQKPKEWNPVIDPANFVSVVDNPYFPLPPGRSWRYQGETKDGVETVEVEVMRGTRTIMGVSTLVVLETSTVDGQLVEKAENWFAQDRNGTVWYFGEATQDYENGVPTSTAGSWQAGVDGAKPGIIMLGNPHEGGSYFQEYAEGIAQDMAEVMSTSKTVEVGNRVYTNVLQTKEWNPLEPGSAEHKFYAPGVGLIKETSGSESLELTEADD